ncbi:hypothetical protein AXX17_AT3G40490 [Arabidopsis thaliana]|uniref:Uncharacterized protein n=1 Tax=Arabidopsis thaliana TaxID=3702 RepID=A0A178VKB1_ARATH|nr:hypothetical protein AXX17_AT3G40490 [Arabidopsis thaliana]
MEAKRRKVLVPIPAQGHVTPMMQLGKALNSKGFSITVVEGHFNQVNSSSQHFPCFKFVTIKESLPESEFGRLGGIEFMLTLNKTSEASFKDSISLLLLQQGNDIACIIFDEYMYFCGAAAKEFNLPSVIFSTQSAANYVSHPDMQDKVVENLYPLRYKDLPTSGMGPLDRFFELCREVANKRTASAVIINTVSCLENSSLSWLEQKVGISVYPLGPLHMTASPPSSLLEEDRSCIEWLNKQKPRSVIYISIGTLGQLETKESHCQRMSIKWSLRGYIVKRAPQIEVLGHPAMGGFWSHCGWNSILESIGEGVPMICRPFHGEQKLNAMYIESVWRIGFQVDGKVDRGEVERAVKKLIVDDEGAGMRERSLVLKEKIKASVSSGGTSYNALEDIVSYLKAKQRC